MEYFSNYFCIEWVFSCQWHTGAIVEIGRQWKWRRAPTLLALAILRQFTNILLIIVDTDIQFSPMHAPKNFTVSR